MKHLTGQKFGRLTVIGEAPNKGKYKMWECLCECGNTTEVKTSHLNHNFSGTNSTKSCGCLVKENGVILGNSRPKKSSKLTSTYQTWATLKTKYNKGKIKLCDKWLNFEGFLEDMGIKPMKSIFWSLNTTEEYGPKTCIWRIKGQKI